MIGDSTTYDVMDQVDVFLDTGLKVDEMTVLIPGVRLYTFTRSTFAPFNLHCVTAADGFFFLL